MDKLKNINNLDHIESVDKLYETLAHYPKAVIISTLMYLNYNLANKIFTEEERQLNSNSDNQVGSSMAERLMLMEIMDVALEEYEKKLDTLENERDEIVH
tara:strand:- start:212 stop:511 length:300 start_codon:yes stop_codon:yes gene_type:complete